MTKQLKILKKIFLREEQSKSYSDLINRFDKELRSTNLRNEKSSEYVKFK